MKRLALASMILCSGCGDLEFFLRDDCKPGGPVKLVIGEFISRDMNYDPFIAGRFMESLCFVFFRDGYDVRIVRSASGYDNPGDTAVLCAGASADMLIHGVISRITDGPFAGRSVHYSVSFVVRDRSGKIIGGGIYRDSNVDEPDFIRDASESFVSVFSRQVPAR